jgi:hypothetical protein
MLFMGPRRRHRPAAESRRLEDRRFAPAASPARHQQDQESLEAHAQAWVGGDAMANSSRTVTVHRPRCLAIEVLGVVAVAVLASACSEQGSAAEQDANAPIRINVAQTFIGIENRAGLPLTDVRLVVEVYGGTEYVHLVPRVENAERRDVMLNALASRDGTPFRRSFVRPKAVRVTASDPVGRRYEVERPWE